MGPKMLSAYVLRKKLEEEVLRLSYIKNEVEYNEEEKWRHSIQEYEKKDTRKHTQHFYTQYKSWKEINEEVEIVILVNGQYSQDLNHISPQALL